MGKVSRKKKKNSRDSMKNKKKAAAKAQYEAWRDQGINSKSRRAQKNKELNRKVRMNRNRKRSKKLVTVVNQDWYLDQRLPTSVMLTSKQHRNTMSFKKFLRNMPDQAPTISPDFLKA